MISPPPIPPLFPYTTLFRSNDRVAWALLPLRLVIGFGFAVHGYAKLSRGPASFAAIVSALGFPAPLFTAWATSLLELAGDRKSTRLNSSHPSISYAVFCLKK